MSVLKIVEWPSKILLTPAEKVTAFDSELKKLVTDMQETMSSTGGIGLAANQVGILKQVTVIHVVFSKEPENFKKEWWYDKPLVFINPVITKKVGKTVYQEGCLSFPNIYENINRSAELWVTAQDVNGKEFETHATGDLAVCLQHEIDHLNGIVFIDRMSRLKYAIVKRKLLRSYNAPEDASEMEA